MLYRIIGAIVVGVLVAGCKMNTKEITTASSGLQYQEIEVGTGATPQKGQTVVVHYTGTLADGKKFDSSVDRGQPFKFTLGIGQVIKGWDEGLSTMQVGGKRKLIIPAHLGYGPQAVGNIIPPNSTLHFDVELLGIEESFADKQHTSLGNQNG